MIRPGGQQTCCPNCGIGEVDGPPWNVIVFCPLHVAAPDLLEALEQLLEWESRMGGWGAPCWEQAHAAIAKATGPQAR